MTVPRSRKGDPEMENEELEGDGLEADADEPIAADEDAEDAELELDDVPASAAGKASAQRLLDMFIEAKSLQLTAKKPGKALIEAVARVLESPLPIKARATKLSDAVVDSDDVDEFFVDDETLVELLKRW